MLIRAKDILVALHKKSRTRQAVVDIRLQGRGGMFIVEISPPGKFGKWEREEFPFEDSNVIRVWETVRDFLAANDVVYYSQTSDLEDFFTERDKAESADDWSMY